MYPSSKMIIKKKIPVVKKWIGFKSRLLLYCISCFWEFKLSFVFVPLDESFVKASRLMIQDDIPYSIQIRNILNQYHIINFKISLYTRLEMFNSE